MMTSKNIITLEIKISVNIIIFKLALIKCSDTSVSGVCLLRNM